MRQTVLCLIVLVASACGGAAGARPTPAPTADPTVGLAVPDGPVLFEPEQLIYPPEAFPIPGAAVTRDAPVAVHGWERQFTTGASPDFRWFTLRLFVLEPDVPAAAFVRENGCGSVTWPDEKPAAKELPAPAANGGGAACVYTFTDGARAVYLTTSYRNVGLLVGTQPRRDAVTNALATDWVTAIARDQIAIIGKVLIEYPPPTAASR
jgi:hypothetical protein